MKYKIVFLFILLTVQKLSASHLDIVTLEYPPYIYQQEGVATGAAVEVIKEVFFRMEQPILIKTVPWARAIALVNGGHVDAIFTIYKTISREKFLLYSNEVLISQPVSLFIKENSSIVFERELAKLSLYQFGVVRKVSYGKNFDEAIKNGMLKNIQLANNGEQNFKKLFADRVDIVVSNKYVGLYILEKTKKLNKVKELPLEQSGVLSYIAFSKKKNLSAVRDEFDLILSEMKNDGSYYKIIDSFLSAYY